MTCSCNNGGYTLGVSGEVAVPAMSKWHVVDSPIGNTQSNIFKPKRKSRTDKRFMCSGAFINRGNGEEENADDNQG